MSDNASDWDYKVKKGKFHKEQGDSQGQGGGQRVEGLSKRKRDSWTWTTVW